MNEIMLSPQASIKTALTKINDSGYKCLVILDESKKLMGTLSDGDIRKAILSGRKITDSIETVFNANPIFLIQGFDIELAKTLLLEKKIDIIPVLTHDGELYDFISWDRVFPNQAMHKQINAPVVIMAGGLGSRLKPFTNVLPKPLIPVHDKPIINHIIDKFLSYGMNNYWVTVNHKSRILKAYFQEFCPDYNIGFINESKPMGTAGSLQLLKGSLQKPFFVSNCDVLIQSDYADLYEFHQRQCADITLVASMKNYRIPYGTCELDGDGFLDGIKEKPEFNLLVNTGFYVMNPNILDFIPRDSYYDMDQLIRDARSSNMNVAVYPISDSHWIDVGQWEEYKNVINQLEVMD